MALVLADRVQETSVSTGSGPFVLSGAGIGYQTFATGIGSGNTTYYTITDGTNWMDVLGTYTASTNTLSVDTVLSSSNSGAAVVFGATVKSVFCNYPATKAVIKNASNVVNFLSNEFVLQDATDETKQAVFSLSANSTGTTRTYTLPNTSSTLVDLATTQTLSGTKTFSATTINMGSATATGLMRYAYGATVNGSTKTVELGTNGASGSTTNISIGSAVSGALGTTTLNQNAAYRALMATSAAAPTIASAATIAPTKPIVFVSGTSTIATITAPTPISLGGGQITIIPTGVFTTSTSGNIAIASAAVVGRTLIMTYDATTMLWYPSY